MSDHDKRSQIDERQEQRERETHGDDPRAYSKYDEMRAESNSETGPDAVQSIYDNDPALKYCNDNRIDHVLPNGMKVMFWNEGKFKKCAHEMKPAYAAINRERYGTCKHCGKNVKWKNDFSSLDEVADE